MWSQDGVSLDWNSSPVTPSIAAAATDRACTSSPTLVRSVNTGASHNCRIGRAGGPCSVTHEHVCVRPRPATTQQRAVTPYRLAGATTDRGARMSLTRIHNLSVSLDGFANGEPQTPPEPAPPRAPPPPPLTA